MTTKGMCLFAGALFAVMGGLLLLVPNASTQIQVLLATALVAVGVGTFMCGVLSTPDGEMAATSSVATAGLTLTLFGAGLLGFASTQGSVPSIVGGAISLALGLLLLLAGVTGKAVRD